jgi:hypothetical protein
VWQGFAFDPGARDVSELLMPRSREQEGRRGPKDASSEAEAYARGRNPLVGRELTRGAKALDRGGDTLMGRHALERGGGLSRCGARPSSETEVRPRGTASGDLMGR